MQISTKTRTLARAALTSAILLTLALPAAATNGYFAHG